MKYLPDIPKYKTHPVPERFLFMKIVVLLVLGILLYIGISVNYYLLHADMPLWLNIVYLVGIILLILMEILLCYMKYNKIVYTFYEHFFEIASLKKERIEYASIKSVSYTSNIIDSYFKTGTIIVTLDAGRKIPLKHLTNSNETYFFMQKQVG